ncbi:hypothetical protein LOK49_LG08G00412 [Camellia lanceoleosa]|uniref:Uncharacterized protein n=1 Tax=Camellia lanceoleosa TaxID=1840588 RepID=A0ACC0GSQ9_9ERIC|nr:hypothetical protein LOK49_LG08G00412 [Camellia lanceoleosa]
MADLSDEEYFSYFPDDFKKYMYKELNWLPSEYFDGGVFWSREDDKPQRPSTLPDGVTPPGWPSGKDLSRVHWFAVYCTDCGLFQ